MGDILKTVTFGIIAYNEHRYLLDLLNDLLKQTYPKELTEVILVDGESTDDTWQIMLDFQNDQKHNYKAIKLLKNSMRVQPSGWNLVIQNYNSEILLRIDAHARIPDDFIEKNMFCINSGEYVCGGPRENIIDEDTSWKNMLLMAEQSMFGSGFASYRHGTNEKKYVKSLFHAAYRKEVIDHVGLFNEKLYRTEDNEYHYRVRKAGYKICYSPEIHSYYQTRNNLKSMLKQKFLNGMWIGRTFFICRGSISLFHLIPLAFVIAILLTIVGTIFGLAWPAVVLWIGYCMANFLMTMIAIFTARKKDFVLIFLPFVFLSLHVSYGIGTLFGFFHRR